jgi:triacylglycerol lipase
MRKLLALLTAVLLAAALFAPAAQAGDAPADVTGACATKYPILLVHGAGFRDMSLGFINYWGRIPALLESRGAKIYYGGTDGWGNIEDGAVILKATIEKVLAETGAEKVNLVAHSKGGLEARYMIASMDMAGKVASLTTIATPHGGSKTIAKVLGLPDFLLRAVAAVVNGFCRLTGDKNPDFYGGIHSFAEDYMEAFNEKNPDQPGVYYQSFAGVLYAPTSDFILAIPAALIKSVDGPNDGMVAVEAAKWTNFRGILQGTGHRGISHADEVDFRRKDVPIHPILGAETVPAFYAAVVAELKQMGY